LVVAVAAMATAQFIALPGATAASKNASQVLSSSKAAADGESSFHYVAISKYPGQTVTITGDVSASEGHQTIVNDRDGEIGHVSVSLVGGSAYFEGDEPGLANFMGLPPTLAATYEGRWISLTQADKEFSTVAAGLTTSSALGQVRISKPLSLGGTSQKMGHPALAIRGTDSGTPAGSTKRVTIAVRLYVSSTGKPLPVVYSASGTVNKKTHSQSVSFSGWGVHVNVTTPSGSIPVGTLGASPVEA
jgi:hypothetical protein